MFPSLSAPALAIGSYFGILSITNIWLSVYRDDSDRAWMQGTRGLLYSLALLASLIGELARLEGANSLQLSSVGSLHTVIPVPPALAMELVAAVLIVIDPLVVQPLVRWIEEGVERSPAPLDDGVSSNTSALN
jgi:hypothetical protein